MDRIWDGGRSDARGEHFTAVDDVSFCRLLVSWGASVEADWSAMVA